MCETTSELMVPNHWLAPVARRADYCSKIRRVSESLPAGRENRRHSASLGANRLMAETNCRVGQKLAKPCRRYDRFSASIIAA